MIEADGPDEHAQSQNPTGDGEVEPLGINAEGNHDSYEQESKPEQDGPYDDVDRLANEMWQWLKGHPTHFASFLQAVIALGLLGVTMGQLMISCSGSKQEAELSSAATSIGKSAGTFTTNAGDIATSAGRFTTSASHINDGVGHAVGQLQDQVSALQKQLAIEEEEFVITHTSMAVQFISMDTFPLKGKPSNFVVQVRNNGPQPGAIENYDIAAAYRTAQPCTEPGRPVPYNTLLAVANREPNTITASLPFPDPPHFVGIDSFKKHPLYVWGKISYGVSIGSDVTAPLTFCEVYTYERVRACGLPIVKGNPRDACLHMYVSCPQPIDTPACIQSVSHGRK